VRQLMRSSSRTNRSSYSGSNPGILFQKPDQTAVGNVRGHNDLGKVADTKPVENCVQDQKPIIEYERAIDSHVKLAAILFEIPLLNRTVPIPNTIVTKEVLGHRRGMVTRQLGPRG
jgi:hypothetical protein